MIRPKAVSAVFPFSSWESNLRDMGGSSFVKCVMFQERLNFVGL